MPHGAQVSIPSSSDASTDLHFIWLELTDKCNLSCIHCYADSTPHLPLHQRMAYGDWKRVLSEAYELGCRNVQFIGGEPAIYPHLSDLIENARSLGYEFVEVFTNGTVLTEKLKQVFKRFGVIVAFSFYGSEPTVHEAVTLQAGSYAKTVQSIKWAVENELQVRVAIVETEKNAATIEATKAFLTSLGVTSVGVDRVRGIGRGSRGVQIDSQFDELCGKCWDGRLCITPKGEIFPCVFSRFCPVGTIDFGLAAALQGERLSNFRSTVKSKARSSSSCNPQCGPDCSPATCNPQTNCNPFCGPGRAYKSTPSTTA
jgi:organic radical activating enzyme